jgi:nicotinamide riboside kinase
MRIAIVGAECTGKKTLQHALIDFLRTMPGDGTAPVVENTDASLAGLAGYDLVLLTTSDLRPSVENCAAIDWATRELADRQLRAALIALKIPFAAICGEGQARIQCALDALAHFQKSPLPRSTHDTDWKWICETCSDAECEHQLFSKLLAKP